MDYLVIDIETECVEAEPSINDKLVLMVWKDSKGNEGYFTIDNLYDIQKKIEKYSIIIGYNISRYDIPILEKYGCIFKWKVIIDEYDIIKKRNDVIEVLNGLPTYTLSYVSEVLQLTNQKQKGFDYSLLKNWKEHEEEIVKYALQDIRTEYDLFIWLVNFFTPFEYGLSPIDISKFKHVSLSTSAYAYKVICRKSGIKEEYEDDIGDYKGQFKGGFVATPEEELVIGDIRELDFSSAYPHAYMQANLFSNDCKCCKEHEKYNGGHLFNLKGRYCSKKFGKIEEVIREIFNERAILKKLKDKRQYALKILINIMYGICGNPRFKSVYNLNRASDCTLIGRECIIYAREKLREKGYGIIYSDTDSIYVKMNNHTEDELIKDKNLIISQLKYSLVFPQDTFDMPLGKRLKLIYLPKKMKKNYICLTTDGEVIVKGLKIIKSNSQRVSGVVFEKYIKPKIIEECKVKWEGKQIKEWIEHELQNNIELAAIWMRVIDKKYKLENQLQSQILNTYGSGLYKMIPNFKKGVGIGIRLCTIEEFKQAGLGIKDINIQQAYNELQIFTDDKLICHTQFKLGSRKRMVNTLEQWLI